MAKKKGSEAVAKLPLMHGIPISVKDKLNMKGMLSTNGCAYLADGKDRAEEDSVIVK